MLQRELFHGASARAKLKTGIDALADMVKVTLGPKGKNVIISKGDRAPLITKDGVSVAREVFLADPVENMGAQLLKVVSRKTNETAGDGTTTATVIAQALITEGVKNVAAGANPMDLKRGMDAAVKLITRELDKVKVPVQGKKDVVQVATVSANNDSEIGEIIATAIEEAGEDGIVLVEDAKGVDTEISKVEGFQLDRGFISPYFINRPGLQDVELKNVSILLYNSRLSDFQDLGGLMDSLARDKKKSLLIIADEFGPEVLKLLIQNKGVLPSCAITSPKFGDFRKDVLLDVATLVNTKVVDETMLSKTFTLSSFSHNLGHADKVLVSREGTIIIGGSGEEKEIEELVKQIRQRIEITTVDYDRQRLQERLGRLTGGIVSLKVGASTETELQEKKMRIEDALHATRAAIDEGIVPGGGVAFLKLREQLKDVSDFLPVRGNREDQLTGIKIVYEALKVPFLSICKNAGLEGEVILRDVNMQQFNHGYNALTDEFGDLVEHGIIDPVKVVRLTLENACSIASLFLTTEGIISQTQKEKDYQDQMMLNQPVA